MSASYRITTFGCKVNQYESQQIAELLERLGLQAAPSSNRLQPADLHIVNTCVVTGEAARRCRQMIRWTRRHWPQARIVVTGCYVSGPEAQELEALEAVDVILSDKASLPARLPDLVMSWFPQADAACSCGRKRMVISSAPADGGLQRFAGHARAFVKIQDGCDQFCTYCIVPHVRSVISSRPPADVVAEVRRLARGGQQEVVLSGIHLGRYRHEVGDLQALPRLLEMLLDLPEPLRLRLSSIEIGEISPQLLQLMAAAGGTICPHLHIPLQSGDDALLAAMNRPYNVATFADGVQAIRQVLPEVALSTDVIVGFPGESDQAFARTLDLVRQLGFSRLHVFPFSPRNGTPAATMAGQVLPQVRQARAAELRSLGDKLAEQYCRSLVGKSVTVLVEELRPANKAEAAAGAQQVVAGLDEHYVRVQAQVHDAHRLHPTYGHLLPVRIQRYKDGHLQAIAGESPF